MKIITLSIVPYKEKDAIIDAISEEGDITFLAKGIMDPKNKNASLNNILLIAETTKVLLQEEEKTAIFPYLLAAVMALKNSGNIWPILLSYTAKVLKMSGYDFSVNQCVFCGTKQKIVTFSFKDGGFVCENCFEEGMEKDLTNTQMLLIRSAFNTEDFKNIQFSCNEEDAKTVLNKFLEFINDSYGISLKSAALLKK